MRTPRFLLPQSRRPRDARPTGRIRGLVRSDESGFTLIELVVATGVILTALTLVTTVITTGVTQTGVARQRQSADGLANQTLEQIRALPFTKIQEGLLSTDTSGDSNITSSGCPTAPCFGTERLVTSAGLANVEPLVPHQNAIQVGPTTYTISSYVTYYENKTDTNTYRATVYVHWTSKPSGRASKVQVQTVVFSPEPETACLATSTHPFSGPCNPSYSAAAIADAPSIAVTGTVAGVTLDHLRLSGGRVTSDLLVEQITRAEGLTQAPGATLQALAGQELSVGGETAKSKADNDPGATNQSYSTAPLSSAPSTQSVGGVSISTIAGNSGTTTSTTSATTPTNACPNLTGYTNENDSQPCGGSTATTGAPLVASAFLNVLGTTGLASISPQVAPVVGITDINKGPGSGTPGLGTCPATPTTGDGCTRAYLNRAGADIGVVGLGALAPIGFTQYVKVVGLADQVKTEAGPGTNAPTATVTGGTVQYWTGLGYTNASISTMVSPITIPTLSIDTLPVFPNLSTVVTLTGSIQPPTKSTSTTTVTAAENPTCIAGTCRTSAVAKSSGPTITVHMFVKVLGVTIADLDISVDTGTVQSRTTYTPTPLA